MHPCDLIVLIFVGFSELLTDGWMDGLMERHSLFLRCKDASKNIKLEISKEANVFNQLLSSDLNFYPPQG